MSVWERDAPAVSLHAVLQFHSKEALEALSRACFFLPVATQGGLSFPLPLFLGFLGCEQSRYSKYILEF